MIKRESIYDLVGNHVSPYMYGNSFVPGETVIPYSGPYWDSRETVAAINAFLNGKWITAGEYVHNFEEEFSRKFDVKHSLMVNSGSSANLVMIAALKKYFDWADADEIIVSPVGFPTTISVIYQNRLTPIFADIEWDTLNFDLHAVEKKITNRTRAIFVSPVLGNPPDMMHLVNICIENRLKLIFDNCDSLGSRWGDSFLTDYAVSFSNSFYPSHHIGIGEGGMVCTNDSDLMRMMRSIATWGRDCHCVGADNLLKDGTCNRRFDKWLDLYDGVVDHKYIFSNMGYNLKPLDLQGAIGLVQLEKFDEIAFKRKRNKKIIEDIIVNEIDGILGVYTHHDADVCWFGVPFICANKDLKRRFISHLEKNKIQTRNYFSGNILLHKGFSFLGDHNDYPEANKVLDLVFFLGCTPHYTDGVFSYITEVVKSFKF